MWSANIIIAVPVCILIILFTTISNILVIYAIFTYPPLKKSQNLLLVSLALADISCAVFVMPINVYWNVIGEWQFSRQFCVFHLSSDSTLTTASILNLVAIALDRYWAIFDPINYTFRRNDRLMVFMGLVCWLLAVIIVVVPALAFPSVFKWPTDDCHFPRGFIVYLTVGQFGIPLIIMSIIYYLIYSEIKKKMRTRKDRCAQNVMICANSSNDAKSSTSQETAIDAMEEVSLELQETSHTSHTSQSMNVKCDIKSEKTKFPEFLKEKQKISIAREKRAVKVLGIVVGVFVVCWMPFFVMDCVFFFWDHLYAKVPLEIINIVYWLGYVNSTCNPVIYTIFNRDFRKAFKKMFRIN